MRLPRHVAIIMDGNGRWARQRGLPRTRGHDAGSDAVRRIVKEARRLGIERLTLYAFSEQNWQRPQDEVSALMSLLQRYLQQERDELLENSIRLNVIGRRHRLPKTVQQLIAALESASASCDGMILTLALSYGGQEELVDCARALAERAASGELDPATIDHALFEEQLPSATLGPVDLLIRTSGEQRISNFLLWSAAYAELYFTDKHWPDMHAEDLQQAIVAYRARDRRFGRVLEPTPELRTVGE